MSPRVVRPHLPDRSGVSDGLAWNLFAPRHADAFAGAVVLHGAGSRKESHHDFARVAAGLGFATLVADLRGHGESAGAMGAGAIDDVATLAGVVREQAGVRRVVLRGSSMGGYLAIVAAAAAGADAVIAICPASAEMLRRGIAAGRYGFAADLDAVGPLLADHDAGAAIAAIDVPVLLMHARGDESVPVEHSRELAALGGANVRLLELPGGDHRSVQHDAELQGESLRRTRRALDRLNH